MASLNLLAIDLGASNGRAVEGLFDGDKLTINELHRFSNDFIDLNGIKYWDILRLFSEIKAGLSKANSSLASIGIDSWGVDFGLIDKRGQLLSNVRSYRMASDKEMFDIFKIKSERELYDKSGLTSLNFNTIFQLYRRKQENDISLNNADKILMIPDLLGYFLSGEIGAEYTNATTTMLYDPIAKNWNFDLINELGFDKNIFPSIQPSSTIRGKLLPSIREELNLGSVDFVAVGTHDTASAVAAVPAKGKDFAFLSSGTWSLFGTETDAPVFSDEVFNAHYSNEGTIQGGFRPLKNIMGLWLIQECRREWIKNGNDISYDTIVNNARAAKPFRSLIDPDYADFFEAGNMQKKIQDYCAKTGQAIPETVGEVSRCIYESLALKYRWALDRLEEIKGEKIQSLNIVGGGIQNKLLNQFAANATNRTVITGPIEGACIGNLLSQAIALGELKDINELREVVRRSFDVEEYYPQDVEQWEEAYQKLMSFSI